MSLNALSQTSWYLRNADFHVAGVLLDAYMGAVRGLAEFSNYRGQMLNLAARESLLRQALSLAIATHKQLTPKGEFTFVGGEIRTEMFSPPAP